MGGLHNTLLLLHPVARIEWTQWSIHWSTVAGIVALGALYFWRANTGCRVAEGGGAENISQPGAHNAPSEDVFRASPFREAAAPRGWQKLSFCAGLFVIFATLNGPIHDLSDYYLFSAHMVQHLLLTLLLPPLLIAGTPGWMLRPLLRNPIIAAIAKFVTKPLMCFTIFNLILAFWHIPIFYNAAMDNHNIHILEHLMFMAGAVLMWWPFLSPLPELPRLAYPGQMLYCFLTTIPMSVIAVYISMAEQVLYPAYAVAPRLLTISPMADQQIGGLIMWIPGSIVFYAIMTVVFFKWAARGEDSTAGAQVDWPTRQSPPTHRAAHP